MAQPFSNPIYKARIKSFLKDRELKIKRRKEEQENLKDKSGGDNK